jgi:hypothetical protein
MMETPDFYFASSEVDGLEEPREAHRVRRIGFGRREDAWLIRLNPPLRGADYGGDRDADTIVVAPRHEGATIWSPQSWPIYVYVLVPTVSDALSRDHLELNEAENVAWAALYKTEGGARLKVTDE